jgi:xanthine dehydrogenase YagT iron-sulfur-binding subunit
MTILVGDLAPDVALPLVCGSARRLCDLRGSPVVVAFHEPHWDPARAAHVEGIRQGAGSGRCGPGAAPVFIRNDDEAATRFDVSGRSAVFIVDADGTISWRHIVGTDAIDLTDGTVTPSDRHSGDAAVTRSHEWTRREFVAAAFAAVAVMALEPSFARAEGMVAPETPGAAGGAARPVTLTVNRRDITLTLEPRVTLLDALREYAGLTGSKKGCDHGQCGACTVHVDGRRVLSCLTFAVMQQGKSITTVEGLAAESGATGDGLHPMQQAFIEHDGFQCGYCTSGQLMSATAVLHEPCGPADDDVREAMSGNICRCGAYPGIVAAVQDVRRRSGGQGR